MKQIKLALNMEGLDPSGTELQANTIYMALTSTTNFPGLAPYLPILATGISDLRSALTAPQYASVAVHNRVIHVRKVLNAIKGLVELECGNDEEKALSSGFTLRQGNSIKPKSFNAVQGNVSGTVDLVCPFAGTRAAYVWELTTDISVATDWKQFKISNTTSTQVSGLSPGIRYWFRVRAIVQDEEQPYSDPHLVHVV
jgi:hypothetical protein